MLLATGALGVAAVSLGVTAWATLRPPPTRLHAKELRIEGAEGQVVIRPGNVAVIARLRGAGVRVSAPGIDSEGYLAPDRVMVGNATTAVGLHSIGEEIGFGVIDHERTPVMLQATKGGGALLTLGGDKGTVGAVIEAHRESAEFRMLDAKGTDRAMLSLSPTGPLLRLNDEAGTERCALGAAGLIDPATGAKHITPESSLLFFKPSGPHKGEISTSLKVLRTRLEERLGKVGAMAAAQNAVTYLTHAASVSLLKPLRNVQLEEIERGEDGDWEVTLSFSHVIPPDEPLPFELGPGAAAQLIMGQKEVLGPKQYRLLKVDRSTGEVNAIKMRTDVPR
jgi:hypothetical protein